MTESDSLARELSLQDGDIVRLRAQLAAAEAKLARIREAWARYDVDHEPGMASVVEPRTLVALRAAIEDE